MGMYDREPNFEDHFQEGDRFAVLDMKYVGTIQTQYGPAEKTLVTIVTRASYPDRATYSMLGAGFANLARRASPGDFPHVAEYVRVPLDQGRSVKTFAPVAVGPKAFVDGDDGPPLPQQDPLAAHGTVSGGADDGGMPF